MASFLPFLFFSPFFFFIFFIGIAAVSSSRKFSSGTASSVCMHYPFPGESRKAPRNSMGEPVEHPVCTGSDVRVFTDNNIFTDVPLKNPPPITRDPLVRPPTCNYNAKTLRNIFRQLFIFFLYVCIHIHIFFCISTFFFAHIGRGGNYGRITGNYFNSSAHARAGSPEKFRRHKNSDISRKDPRARK